VIDEDGSENLSALANLGIDAAAQIQQMEQQVAQIRAFASRLEIAE
jgi:hypothetical protein